MTKALLTLLLLALSLAFVAAQDKKEEAKKDDAKKEDAKKEDTKKEDAKKALEKLQGTWKTEVIVEASGKRSTNAKFGESSLVIKEDKYVFTLGPEEVDVNGTKVKVVNKEEGTLKIDPAMKPMTMDVIIAEGESASKGKTQLGIYELDGDSLKVTVNEPGDKERPKEMSKGAVTFTFRKEKK